MPGYAALARAGDLGGLPPAYICVGNLDGFRDDATGYATRLNQAGVPAELHVYAGVPHGVKQFADVPVARRYIEGISEWIGAQLQDSEPQWLTKAPSSHQRLGGSAGHDPPRPARHERRPIPMANPSSAHPEVVVGAWSAMRAFVAAHDRRRELQEALGLGRGLGRVKVLVLLTDGALTLRDIAEATGVDASYATVIVDKLVSRGLVERTAHPDDNRRKLVKLTASGRDAAALAEQILAEPPPHS